MSEPIRPTSRHLPGFTISTEGDWSGEFSFVQAADTQLGLQERYVEKKIGPIAWDREVELAKLAMIKVNAMKPRPRFMIICGDLVDAMPGDPNRTAQIRDLFRCFTVLCPDVPLVCLCGNHDVGDHPTPASIQLFKDDFGDDYFHFWVGGVKCLVLNSQLYEDPSECQDLKAEQDAWLDEQLTAAENSRAKHLLVFQHIPWFLNSANEPKEYFNIELKLRMEMLDKFSKAGVRAIFCGHYHRNAGGFHGDMELVVTSAIGVPLGSDSQGFRIVKVTEKEVTHKYWTLADLPDE